MKRAARTYAFRALSTIFSSVYETTRPESSTTIWSASLAESGDVRNMSTSFD